MKKNNNLIIDTSVYITYARNGKLYRMYNAIAFYELYVFVNDNLLLEFERNMADSKIYTAIELTIILNALKDITIHFDTISLFQNSPDTKDNFLFDLAIQTESKVIVTKEKALLNFKDSPVAIHDIKWFKETYPVEL